MVPLPDFINATEVAPPLPMMPPTVVLPAPVMVTVLAAAVPPVPPVILPPSVRRPVVLSF